MRKKNLRGDLLYLPRIEKTHKTKKIAKCDAGGATPIAEEMGVVDRAMTHSPYVWDWCRYLKKELGQDTENKTFGDVEMLGLPCKTVSIPEGTIIYWQNLILGATAGDTGFAVTKLDILDNPK